MDKRITSGLTIGLDLGDRWTEGRVLDESGEVIEAFRVRTTEPAMDARLSSYDPCRVVLEVGTHSPWVSRCVAKHGHAGIVANPRRVRLIAENDSKSDGVDAELLGRLGRVDPSLLKPIVHRGLQAQRTALLRQVPGVGPITALYYVLTIEDPSRFAKSRSVGAYLGLRPKRRDSGDQQPQLRITKAGDRLLRRLLVSAAHYILGPLGPDTDLRRAGLRGGTRGGSPGRKRAIVAVARRLAVLLHRLWVTGEEYEPLRSEAAQAS